MSDFTARSQPAEPDAPRNDSLTRRIPEILGAHRLEQGMRIGKGERVEWWECLGCDWKSELFDLGAPGIEAIKRNHHHAELIAKAAEDHYRPRVETVEQLDALAVRTVLKEDWPSTDGGAIWERWNSSEPDGEWVRLDSCAHIPGRKPFLPAVVLYLPEGADE